MNTWRERARAVIQRVVAAYPDADPATIRKAVSYAYPFGERKYHPYKVWLAEVRAQLGPAKLAPVCESCGGKGWLFVSTDLGSVPCDCARRGDRATVVSVRARKDP